VNKDAHFILLRDAMLAQYAVVVRLSVCLSQVSALLRRLNVRSREQRSTVDQGLQFSDAEDLGSP